jgi:hypothetical protein
MLNQEFISKIEEFVTQKPRSINEIALHINKNWRTVDRYVEQIIQERGTIQTRTFRGGTRGALKVVYWNLNDTVKQTKVQELLENRIIHLKNKEDFSGFDIFQQIKDKNKKITIEEESIEENTNLDELKSLLENTKKQLLVFSGNLSWTNLKNKKTDIFKSIEDLIKRNVKIKVICRVDLTGKKNIERLLSLNFKYNKELIEIHHQEQPLRAIIFDEEIFRIKEINEPTGKLDELEKILFIFYTIKDKEWVQWIQRIFWKIFSTSIDSTKRLEQINKYFN